MTQTVSSGTLNLAEPINHHHDALTTRRVEMHLVADESDGAAAVLDGVEVAVLSGGVVDERAVVDGHVGVLRDEDEHACAGVDGAIGHETTALDDCAAERTDQRHRSLVAHEVTAIDQQADGARHVSTTNHRRLQPQSGLVQIYDALLLRRVHLLHHIA